MSKSPKLLKLIVLSILSTVAMLLMLLDFPLPLLPSYLKVDFSDVPAIMAAFIFSPIAGVLVEGLKNGLYFLYAGAGDPVGIVANFVAGTLFVLPVAIFYHKYKTVKSVISGIVMSTMIMAIGMSILNYFLFLPAYSWIMGWENMSHGVKLSTIVVAILPFNTLKGLVVAMLFVPLFMKMKPWIEKRQLVYNT
ncbi:riboflavin transporter FmnP [Salirhabdus euzebyi]|uniref:Riboflavin transporter n=1 Tax=Salirhabdus euzebyi TaxID=394506 RepID=A0A841Q4V4_9BACI|nr:ECF transporter S component [Salirhabdus euzebyi]MBB6453407.1 riboflavin transporter FmnP [Salirhabdus euzebyi]